MTGPARLGLTLAVAAGFAAGLIGLFNRQFASGEAYPAFSSLRTDREGVKLLYDSLAKLPGIAVERNFTPLSVLPRDNVAVLLLGLSPMRVNWDEGRLLETAEAIARRGNRVVLAMHVDRESTDVTQAGLDHRKQEPSEPALKRLWGVALRLDPQRRISFQQAGWTVDSRLAIEREFGKGSVVLLAESAGFTNESTAELNGFKDISEELGSFRNIVFDEQHLGLAESGSIVGIARRFRLMGVAFGLALCAALFIWRNSSSFPPPVARSHERYSGRTSHAGLLTLLRRHIAPEELAAVCWREWLVTNRAQTVPEVRERAEAIVAASGARPVEAARDIQELLRSKGRL